MIDCIDREKALDKIWEARRSQQMLDNTQVADLVMHGLYIAESIIEELPSVQPKIIRCKDCKHWMMGKTTKNYPNPYICELHSFMHGFERSALPEDYCSWAELRGDSE